jgi:hypothetical protein
MVMDLEQQREGGELVLFDVERPSASLEALLHEQSAASAAFNAEWKERLGPYLPELRRLARRQTRQASRLDEADAQEPLRCEVARLVNEGVWRAGVPMEKRERLFRELWRVVVRLHGEEEK